MLIFFFTSCSSSLLSLALGLDSEISLDLEVLDSEIIRDLAGIGVLLGDDSDISLDRESGDNAVETDLD